jgi:hypothetical protein
MLLTVGCGNSMKVVPSASQTPVIPAILTQPASQTVPLTQTATFTVVAENPTPVTFQC